MSDNLADEIFKVGTLYSDEQRMHEINIAIAKKGINAKLELEENNGKKYVKIIANREILLEITDKNKVDKNSALIGMYLGICAAEEKI